MKNILSSVLVISALMCPLSGQALDSTAPDSAGRIGNWMVLGAFGHDGCFVPLADVVNPVTAAPCVGDSEAGKTWEQYVPAELGGEWVSACLNVPVGSCNSGRGIDLNCHFSGGTATWGAPDNAMAYGFTYLVVDSDMDVLIHTGSDDGYRYYIDGALVVDGVNACRCYGDSQEVTAMHLTAGTHRVLVQVGESGGHWGFTFGITDQNFSPITTGIKSVLTCDSDGDGIGDNDDACPNSDLVATVSIDGCDTGVANVLSSSGCTISDQIKACVAGATNHGQFVSCVAHLTNQLVKDGVISGKEKAAIQRCVARASIP